MCSDESRPNTRWAGGSSLSLWTHLHKTPLPIVSGKRRLVIWFLGVVPRVATPDIIKTLDYFFTSAVMTCSFTNAFTLRFIN